MCNKISKTVRTENVFRTINTLPSGVDEYNKNKVWTAKVLTLYLFLFSELLHHV